ncbi:MAG TPA: type I 3-dehydroquinate dehydratase [Thermoanaerobaculia bacterium]|nr:type I 3-dehydroquinate dehydratase [Thermoanaerobaculia bacterium]
MDASLVVTVGRRPEGFAFLTPAPDWIELRADLNVDLDGDIDAARLGSLTPATLLYTLRGVTDDRRARLLRAASAFDLIDLECADLDDTLLLQRIRPERRVITWRGRARTMDDLDAALRAVQRVPARLYRLEVETPRCSETLLPMALLKREQRPDLTAYAVGAVGLWTRILAPRLGARIVFGGDDDPIDGMLSMEQLIGDYGFPRLEPADEIFGIVGDPILRSLSPRLHNAGFRALGRRALYLPFHAPDFADFWSALIDDGGLESLGASVGALCVVSPHKEIAVSAARARTPMVSRTCSTNFFVNEGGVWTADTTDPEGVLLTLRERRVEPRGQRVAVVGCGGSGRAMAAALQQAGADVTLVNRGFDRASLAIRLLQLPFVPLASFSPHGYDIVVNATPVGYRSGEVPFDPSELGDDAVVIDLVYGQEPTSLVAATRARGQITIDGRDVLRTQAMSQFHLMTGERMPAEVPGRILGWYADDDEDVVAAEGESLPTLPT